jgi:hypothetical protein
MIPIHIELTLCTPHGPAGMRLQRSVPLPIKEFSFPFTEEGIIEAEKARDLLQNYVNKHVIPRFKKQ